MLSVSNLDLLLYNAMKALCENCQSIAYCIVMLQVIKVKELDVCGSLVLSNPVTYLGYYYYYYYQFCQKTGLYKRTSL